MKRESVILLVVEGRDDVEFLSALTGNQLPPDQFPARWVIHGVGGIDRFRRKGKSDSLEVSSKPKSFVENFVPAINSPLTPFPYRKPKEEGNTSHALDDKYFEGTSSNGKTATYEEITHIALICDADNKGISACFDKMKHVFMDLHKRSPQISIPQKPGIWTPSTESDAIQTGIYILGGPDGTGSLEDLMWSTVDHSKRDCVDQFFTCAQVLEPKAKQLMQAYLALRQDNYCDLARSCEKGHWPLDHPCFAPLVAFLKSVVAA